MREQTINVGLIGLGMIGKMHARAYRQLQLASEARHPSINIRFLVRPGHQVEHDFLAEVGSPPVLDSETDFFFDHLDLVDICTPNSSHLIYAENACRVGAHVYCEKPLARNLSEAQQMQELAQSASVLTHTAFIFRYFPAIQQLKSCVDAGFIGKPFHFRVTALHGGYLNINRPMSWRLQESESGGGVLSDLGIHLIDILRFVLGEIVWIQCETETFIKKRPTSSSRAEFHTVDVDDWAACTLGISTGAVGTLEVSRVAAGKSQATSIQIFGEDGSLAADLANPFQAMFFQSSTAEWKPAPPNSNAVELPVARQQFQKADNFLEALFAAHLASIEDFLIAINQTKSGPVDFTSGVKNQAVLEAAYQSSKANGLKLYLG